MSKQEVDNHNFAIGSKDQQPTQDQVSIHAIPNTSPIDPNYLFLQALSLGASETKNYEDILEELSIVELHCTPPVEERGRDDSQTEELDKQQKRTRLAAQAHNMCERRHTNRINVKMRTLQELIPHCPKRITKASLLERAIEYIKTLQHQAQVLSVMGAGNAASIFQTPYVMAAPGYQIMQLLPTANMMMRPMGVLEMPNYSTNIGQPMVSTFPLSLPTTAYPNPNQSDNIDESLRRFM